ncbi:MAG: DUF1499 domain-containing protein [Pseudomonadota bacterium]
MKKTLKALTLLIAVGAVAFGAAAMFGFEKIWRMGGPADLGPVVWEGLSKGPKPNQGLVCPKGLCKQADMDMESPVYAVDAARLKDAILKTASAEPGIVRVDGETNENELRFVTYSPLMRFPDTTRVRIIPIDETSSTLAMYAQAQVGQTDFGANLARLKRWLRKLKPLEANAD